MCLISYSPKPHLRQVFVRVCRLCREGVSLIVVLDGEAIQLKWAAMDTRAQAVGGGAGRQRTTGRRTNLNRLVKEVLRGPLCSAQQGGGELTPFHCCPCAPLTICTSIIMEFDLEY